MTVWLLWAVNVISFSCLVAAMSKHQRDLFGRALTPKQNQQLKLGGWSLLAVTLFATCVLRGPSIGASIWTCAITFSALVVGLVATYLPLRLKVINAIAAALSGVLLGLSFV